VLDNGISIGEFLVFELVDRSRLVVHVYPRDDQSPRSVGVASNQQRRRVISSAQQRHREVPVLRGHAERVLAVVGAGDGAMIR
jgi:hypothetical protein